MSKFSLISTALCGFLGFVLMIAVWLDLPAEAEMSAGKHALRQACGADYRRLCTGVQPGGGRILACLESHAEALSPACAQAVTQASSSR